MRPPRSYKLPSTVSYELPGTKNCVGINYLIALIATCYAREFYPIIDKRVPNIPQISSSDLASPLSHKLVGKSEGHD